MKIKKKLIYYLAFTLIWILYSIAFFGLTVISMVYIVNSASAVDILIAVGIILLASAGLISLNSISIEKGRLLRIKNNIHIVVWNVLIVLTYILLYFTL